MNNVVYITDPFWTEYLSFHNITNDVNFWRVDPRVLKPSAGAYFYFLLLGSRKIAGRGRFNKIHQLSIEEAWNKYEERNGTPNFQDFRNALVRVFENYRSLRVHKINCIIVDDIIWLSPEKQFRVRDTLFHKNIPAAKYFGDDEITPIATKFYLAVKSSQRRSNDYDENEGKND